MNRSLGEHRRIQRIAKAVLAELAESLHPEDTEASIASRAVQLLSDRGVAETWYYDCPALVLAGQRTCLSVSGKRYVADSNPIGQTNMVTVDLSPRVGDVWGDCARTLFIEAGTPTSSPTNPDLRAGIAAEERLHAQMRHLARASWTYDDLFRWAREEIAELGFENLDFAANVGHSIEQTLDARKFIAAGNRSVIGRGTLFTFEPHIRMPQASWGFKHENIYFFDDDTLVEL